MSRGEGGESRQEGRFDSHDADHIQLLWGAGDVGQLWKSGFPLLPFRNGPRKETLLFLPNHGSEGFGVVPKAKTQQLCRFWCLKYPFPPHAPPWPWTVAQTNTAGLGWLSQGRCTLLREAIAGDLLLTFVHRCGVLCKHILYLKKSQNQDTSCSAPVEHSSETASSSLGKLR